MADQSTVYMRNAQLNVLQQHHVDGSSDIKPVKNFIWEDKPKFLKDLTTLCRLPFTAKVHQGNLSQILPSWTSEKNGDILQILEIRRRKVVVIRKMLWERKTAEYVTGGKQIEVPATYKGWFEVIPEDGRPVEYFDTVQAITGVKPRRFLVRTSIVGYELSVDNGTSCWVPHEISPGEVLTTGIVYMDQKKTKSKTKTFFKKFLKSNKNMKKEHELKYLQCFDKNNKEIMVPLIMSGVFSPIGDTMDGNFDAVYEMQDLILAFNLPLKAQLVAENEEQSKQIPNGMIRIEEVRDEELAVVGRYPVSNDEQTFEIPLSADLLLRRDISKKKKSILHQRKSTPVDPTNSNQEQIYANTQAIDVELPIRVKENKKGKGSGILEKLSVRSKNRRERASLKALQQEGVFSSRLSKSDMNLADDFFRNEIEKENSESSNGIKLEFENSNLSPGEDSNNDSQFTLMNHSHSVSSYFDEKRQSFSPEMTPESGHMRRRDLPPIPNNGSNLASPRYEREAVYEELPVAPKPPERENNNPYVSSHHHDDEDGYMSPAQLRRLQMQEYSESPGVIKKKPPVAPRDKTLRSRRTKSEIPSNYADYGEFKDNMPIDIDELFSFTNERYPKTPDPQYASVTKSPHRTNANKRDFPSEQQRFVDDHALDVKALSTLGKAKSRSHKNLNVAANVTVRSHNIRKVPNVMDVFGINDSFHDSRMSQKNDDSEYGFVQSPKYDQRPNMFENDRSRTYQYAGYSRGGYAESEPGFRRYSRSLSIAGITDPYAKQGEDSILSGDYGYHGDSEYSFNEYSDWRDDGWTPPSDLSNLTVQEVSKSLRYIGMKDRVVIRLANEQIDGALFCSLDKKLLQEGFPELNALEVKKIVDFINGWRPKK